VIRRFSSEGVKTSEIYGRVIVQYGDKCRSHREVYTWVEIFKGRTSVDDKGPQRPLSVTCIQVIEHIDQRIRDN